MSENKKYQTAIQGLQQAIEQEEQTIAAANDNIRSFRLSIDKLKELDGKPTMPTGIKATVVIQSNGSLEKWLAAQLGNDQEPQLTRPLYEKYCAGRTKPPTFATFSGSVGGYITKGTVVKRHILKGQPNATKNWIGLTDWFEENKDVLKNEYLQIVKSKLKK